MNNFKISIKHFIRENHSPLDVGFFVLGFITVALAEYTLWNQWVLR